MLLAQKSELELQRRTLVESKESLSKEKTELMAQQTTLAKDRNSLQTANASLLQRLESISGQLAAKVAALEQIEQQRDRLKKQADALDAIVASLKQRLEELNIDLAESRARATASRTELQTKVKDLEAQIAAHDKTAEEYLAELKRSYNVVSRTESREGATPAGTECDRAAASGGTARGRQ